MARLVALAATAALLAAGCGGSAPKGPPDLVFVSVRDGDYAIFGADADGSHQHRLTKEKGDPSSPAGLFWQIEPAWSPDGSRIAFASKRDGKQHIFVMNADGSGTIRVTDEAFNDEHPAWSHDGAQIVFAREGALYSVAAKGGKARRVGKGIGSSGDPAWSPTGSRIAYDYREPGFTAREVLSMRPDGTDIRRLTKLQALSSWPAWSPDGKRLAFQSDAYAGRTDIYTMPAGGGEPTRVVSEATEAIQPAWAPDGRLSFSLDGAIAVVEDGKVVRLTSGAGIDSNPAWRPGQPQ
jgi:Tol biopolymer transport system component